MYCHKSCYIKYPINSIKKSDETPTNNEDKSKYLTDEAVEKFNRTLSICIVGNKKTFLLHHILWYLEEL